MNVRILFSSLSMALLVSMASAQAPAPATADTRLFELRTYYAMPGKLDALNARFREQTIKFFAKHGMTNIGYWTPAENPERKLIYLLAHPDRAARDKAWKALLADPEWKAARATSEKAGVLVAKSESMLLTATDFSPAIQPAAAAEPRLFELRAYTAAPGRLPNLLARFRDHTVKLFAKHGMEQMGYWTPVQKTPGAENTLVYLLAHKSKDACAESFKTFRADPDWIAAKKASEEKAGGPLTAATNGVVSTLLIPTDYSPAR